MKLVVIKNTMEPVRFQIGNEVEYIDTMLDRNHKNEYFVDVLGSTAHGIEIEPCSGNRVRLKLKGIRRK